LRVAPTITLTPELLKGLTRWSRGRRVSVRVSERARIILLAAQGLRTKRLQRSSTLCRARLHAGETVLLHAGLPVSKLMRRDLAARRALVLSLCNVL